MFWKRLLVCVGDQTMIGHDGQPNWLRQTALTLLFPIPWAIGCSQNAPPTADVVRPVKTMVVTSGDDMRMRSFPGTVEASKRVELAFQVPGLLVTLPVKEGQKVEKDEVIGQLRQDEFKARLTALQGQLDQARAALAALMAGERPEERLRRESQVRAAEARLANARAVSERSKNLLARGGASRQQVEADETAYRVAEEDFLAARQLLEKGETGREEDIHGREAEVRGLEGRVVEANIQLRDTTLRAPYSGVIAQRFVQEGQNVQAKAPVVRLQDVNEIEIVVDVPETVMAAEIQVADIVSMFAELSGAPGVQFPVEIREIAQVADPTTQTFKVRAAMQVPEGIRVLPGMTATATVTYRRAQILGNRILVPINAVFKDAGGGQIVWIVGPNSAVSRRAVKLGEPTGGQVEIVEGLAPGDRIAVAGVTLLRDGMQVRDLGDALGGGPS
jgi:membrane fusion protein, multidrug efflux system